MSGPVLVELKIEILKQYYLTSSMRWSLRQKLLKFTLKYLDILVFMILYPEAQIGSKKPPHQHSMPI